MELTAEEGRVLGCLVEKELTTPQQYPLTENAVLAACNQTTSREPVVQYDVAVVRLAIRGLRDKQLLRTVHRSGERSEKHRHQLQETMAVPVEQQVLLALLLLRGPQTAAELRARTERMHSFASAEEVDGALEALAGRPTPLVERLARQPGQKEARYADLLVSTTRTRTATPAQAPAGTDLALLAQDVAALREEVAELRALLQNRGGSV